MLARELSKLLGESEQHATERAHTRFAEVTGALHDRLVLFGAGSIGRRVAQALCAKGSPPLAIADNNPTLWGSRIADCSVISPHMAVERFGQTAAFVVTIWSPRAGMSQALAQLQHLGCRTAIPFLPLVWQDPTIGPVCGVSTPQELLHDATLVQDAFSLWADESSRREYVAQVGFRLSLELAGMSPPVRHAQYFADDLFHGSSEESFVDCGAYSGDTIRSFLDQRGASFSHITAFEPDETNFRNLQLYIGQVAPPFARGSRFVDVQ